MDSVFLADLRRWGPAAPPRTVSLGEARAYCRRLATRHYENFLVASLLLPRRLLPHFHAVYAWCRWADDLADETGGGAETLRLLAWWRAELETAYARQPRHPVTLALAETLGRFALPKQLFLDLLSAFEQDQRVKEYATFAQLLDYCRRSANPVGRLVLHLFDTFDEEKARLADSICTGLQLANFWQDVSRDADLGRRYVPAEDLDRFRCSRVDWKERRPTPEFVALMRFEVERTRSLLEAGRPLLLLLGAEHRPQVELFLSGGLATLDAIAAQGYDTWTRRPVVSKATQMKLLTKAAAQQAFRSSRNTEPTLSPKSLAFRAVGAVGSHRHCDTLARRHARNFYFAFRLLPAEERRGMTALYAFMRIADDLADGPEDAERKRAALAAWRRQLDDALAGRCRHRVLPALVDTVRRFGIDPAFLHDLLDGVAADVEPGRRFGSCADLELYCYQVAGTVGLCCVRVWGATAPEADPLALAGGRAFQLTNILRDLREDFALGRCYLPLDWLKEAGLDEQALRRAPNGPAARALYRRLGGLAAANFAEAAPLPKLLPPAGRAVWLAMSGAYRGLLTLLQERDFDLTRPRARLSWLRKSRLFAASLPARLGW